MAKDELASAVDEARTEIVAPFCGAAWPGSSRQ